MKIYPWYLCGIPVSFSKKRKQIEVKKKPLIEKIKPATPLQGIYNDLKKRSGFKTSR